MKKMQINKRSPFVAGVFIAVLTVLASFTLRSAQAQSLITVTNTFWKYLADATDQGSAWSAPLFDDSGWPIGRGLFGNDTTIAGYIAVGGFATTINGTGSTPPGPQTAYYRVHFNWVGSTAGVVFTTTNYVDDAMVMYLNGTEIIRYNISTTPVIFSTAADAANPGGEGNAVVRAITLDTNLPANPLVAGDNVLAVEVHQQAGASSDHVWGMSLNASQIVRPCTDGIEPTNRTIIDGRSTTFTVVERCALPPAAIQWYRNVGAGEELITDATGASYTKSNAVDVLDEGVYYARLTNPGGSVDSRQAVLTIDPDVTPPQLLSASIVRSDLNHFILKTDEELCNPLSGVPCIYNGNPNPVDSLEVFSWHVYQADDLSIELGVSGIIMVDPTTYEFTTDSERDPGKRYRIAVDTVNPDFSIVIDIHGNRVPPGTYAESLPQASFQQGDANGYAGTHDTEVRQNTPDDSTLGSRDFFNVDQSDNTIGGGTAGPVNGLIRFDNIFGNNPTQIPPGSTIINVKLVLSSSQANANGNPIDLHRMLIPWDESTTTWNSVVNGISADDIEASVTPDADNFDTALTVPFVITLDSATYPGMLNTVQAWADGTPNYGWALLPTGTDGYRVDSSEAANVTSRPLLVIEYRSAVCSGPPAIVAQPPAAVSANELQSFSITVGVSNACDATFQWTRNGSDITGPNGSTYTVSSATPADNGSYRLRVTNPGGTVTSDAAVVTVHPKTTRPHVTRVVNSANGTTITVAFNEAVVQSAGNYTLTPSVAVNSAVPGANNTVTLTTDPRTASTVYSLRIAGVTDVAAIPNPIDPNPTIVSLTAATPVAGAGWGDGWLYNTNNLDGTPTWKDTGFVPGGDWLPGNALFGTEIDAGVVALFPVPIATPIPPNDVAPGDIITDYFRKSVTLPALGGGAIYLLEHFIDDGAVFYWDGVEFGRFNMTNGPVVYSTRAATANEASLQSIALPASSSAGGTHTLAVEVHQGGATTSSDRLFGAEIVAVSPQPSLSISHSAGANTISWTGDSSWRLVRSAVVTGPYTAVAGNPFNTFVVPPVANTNDAFFGLSFNPAP